QLKSRQKRAFTDYGESSFLLSYYLPFSPLATAWMFSCLFRHVRSSCFILPSRRSRLPRPPFEQTPQPSMMEKR
ncbi:hypothetical protein, partial [Caenibacillus caldisaponilyticus]|uniref:hypothetical protein n=1 Tax=Caenibacillus caldisaponilyticus TaxID=1674942 RepID=UPI001EE6BCF7